MGLFARLRDARWRPVFACAPPVTPTEVQQFTALAQALWDSRDCGLGAKVLVRDVFESPYSEVRREFIIRSMRKRWHDAGFPRNQRALCEEIMHHELGLLAYILRAILPFDSAIGNFKLLAAESEQYRRFKPIVAVYFRGPRDMVSVHDVPSPELVSMLVQVLRDEGDFTEVQMDNYYHYMGMPYDECYPDPYDTMEMDPYAA